MVNRKNPSYKGIEKNFKKIHIDDSYYEKYYKNIIKNKEMYYNICKESLISFQYYNSDFIKDYREQFDSMIEKISTSNLKKLTKCY